MTKLSSTQPPISNPVMTGPAYFYEGAGWAIGPTPPTPEAIERAKFKDKTYVWHGK